jgi:hypothetical protein
MKPRKTMKDGRTLVLAVALLGLTATAVNAQSGPFVPMAGAWSGDGRVVLSDGQVERIRCRATDDVGNGGELMRQHLRCASPSYNFDVRNTVSAHQGRITGNWDETTRNVGGQVFGDASPNLVRARIEGGQFAADVTLAHRGNSLNIRLAPHGTDVREVTVTLRRA